MRQPCSARYGAAGIALELALEPFNVAGVLPQLLVGGAFADAGQGPADGLRAVVRDARGDQRVHDVQLGCLEPDHHVGEFTIGGLAAVFDEPDIAARSAGYLQSWRGP